MIPSLSNPQEAAEIPQDAPRNRAERRHEQRRSTRTQHERVPTPRPPMKPRRPLP